MSDIPFHIAQLPQGYNQVVLHGPAVRPFKPKHRWTPHDAADMTSLMHQRFRGALGFYDTFLTMHQMVKHMGETLTFTPDRVDRLKEIQHHNAASWEPSTSTTILATDDFANMTMAATLSSPAQPLRVTDVLSPTGTIFFAQPLQFPEIFNLSPETMAKLGHDQHEPIRGIHWNPDYINPDEYHIYALFDGSIIKEQHASHDYLFFEDAFDTPTLDPKEYFDHLVISTYATVEVFQPNEPTPADYDEDPAIQHLIALLQSIKAIADSPLSRQDRGDTVGTQRKNPKKSRRRKALDLSSVKVVSLRQPEYGQYELDAAAGYQPKTPQRLHWVRGHWRNQWYPSAQEHRPRWIDGYIKGNAEYGDVTDRPTVYLATGDTPPAGRHETPNKLTTTEGRTQ